MLPWHIAVIGKKGVESFGFGILRGEQGKNLAIEHNRDRQSQFEVLRFCLLRKKGIEEN